VFRAALSEEILNDIFFTFPDFERIFSDISFCSIQSFLISPDLFLLLPAALYRMVYFMIQIFRYVIFEQNNSRPSFAGFIGLMS
jgi:hypothetical protein